MLRYWVLYIKYFAQLFLPVVLIAGYAQAQQSALKFKRLSVKEGLSQSTVFAITQTRNGLMWFGTRTGGLNRYDGYSFKAFKHDPENPCSISGNEITAIYEDNKGMLWVGTRNNGLNKFDYTSNCFTRYFSDYAAKDNTIKQIYQDKKGNIWVAANTGLYLYNKTNDEFTVILRESDGNSNITTAIAETKEGLLWVGTRDRGLCLFNPKTNKRTYFAHQKNNPKSLADNYITSLLLNSNGRVWAGTRKKGISILLDKEKGTFKHIQHNPDNKGSLSSNIIRTIAEDQQGQIWIGTKKGLEQLTAIEQGKDSPTFIHHRSSEYNTHSLSQNSIYSFYIDNRNHLWVGTWSGGVNHLDSESFKFEHFRHQANQSKSLSNNVVSSFIQDGKTIWIGTEGGGLNLFNRNERIFKHYLQDSEEIKGLNSDHIKVLYIDNEKNFWIGTFKGLHLFDRESKELKVYLKGESIYSIADGAENELWVGTSKKLHRFNKKTQSFQSYKYNARDTTQLNGSMINSILKDSKDRIWIGTKSGLHLYNRAEDNFIRYLHATNDKHSISHDHITSIIEDGKQQLWIGTYDGLNKFNPEKGTFKLYGEKIGFPDNVVNGMVMDNQEYLWVATNKGLSRFDLRALEAYENLQEDNKSSIPASKHQIVRNYDTADGLQDDEFIKNACYKNAQGELFFGGINGFNIFNPATIKDNPNIPKVIISNFKLFNKEVQANTPNSPLKQHISDTKSLTLTHKQSVFTFEFVALNYSSPEKNQYAYMMEGVDKDWNYIGNKREVSYTGLPAGEYTFRVKASNNDGLWNKEGTSIHVVILPPWWATPLFRIMMILVLTISALGFYFYRVNALKKQKKVLELKVHDRTARLQEAVVELEEKQEEVMQQSEEITLQAEELKKANIHLSHQKREIEKAYDNSKLLSEFGQKLTATLDRTNISEMIYTYLCSLMDVSAFGIGIYNSQKHLIEFYHFIEDNQKLPYFTRSLNSKNSLVSWCFNNQQPVFINNWETDYIKYIEEKPKFSTAKPPMSNIHIPLSVENKQIGLIAVNSFQRNAYTQSDFTLLQTIASYLAIALDNANAYRIIDGKNHNIESSIRYAQTIQQAILPPKGKLDTYFKNFLFYRPKDIVSGDFYWATSVYDENTQKDAVFIAVVDCTGHGVPGAFMSIIGTNFLNEIVKVKKIYNLPEILDRLDKRIRHFLKQNNGNNDDGMDVCICKIETSENETYTVNFSGAKRPLIYWDSHENKLFHLKGSNKAIGGQIIKETNFENNKITLNKASRLYLTSDGLTDQCDPNRKKFGIRRLEHLLQEEATTDLNTLCQVIADTLDTHQQREEQRDDMTILGIQL